MGTYWLSPKHITLLLFSVLVLYVPSSVSGDEENGKRSYPEVPFETQQLQLLSLLNNLNFCLRDADAEFKEISRSFNPMDHLHLYKDPDIVQDFFDKVEAGEYGTRFQPYNVAGFTVPTEHFFAIIWDIDDWSLLYNTTVYASQRMNTQMLSFCMGTLLDIKLKHLKAPPFYAIFPQTQVLKWIMRKANDDPRPSTVDNSNPENKLRYWRHDPELNSFHGNWHRSFPVWWLASKFGVRQDKKGELFMYFHHNYINRNRAERLSNFMPPVVALSITEPIGPGDIPLTLYVNLTEMPPRRPNQSLKSTSDISLEGLLDQQDKIRQGISDGYFVYSSSGKREFLRNNNGSDYLGDTIESSVKSANEDYYGKMHRDFHSIIALVENPQTPLKLGIMAFFYQALQDPCFSMLHTYIDGYNRFEQYKLPPYSKEDLKFSAVQLNSVRIRTGNGGSGGEGGVPVLKTFFEPFTYDISNGIKSCRKVNSKRKYTTTVTRLNYQPFEYVISAHCNSPSGSRGMVRIYMAPTIGFDGKHVPQQELFWSMFEMDRFPVTLRHGLNRIKRSSLDSSVTVAGHKGFEELANEVKAAVAKNGKLDPYPTKETKSCGWPQNLLLPRGTEDGMQFKMFIIITSNSTGDYDEDDFPQLPYCGNPSGRFPDGLPMGFPFNRRLGQDSAFHYAVHSNYRFMDLIIKHAGDNPPFQFRENQ